MIFLAWTTAYIVKVSLSQIGESIYDSDQEHSIDKNNLA